MQELRVTKKKDKKINIECGMDFQTLCFTIGVLLESMSNSTGIPEQRICDAILKANKNTVKDCKEKKKK